MFERCHVNGGVNPMTELSTAKENSRKYKSVVFLQLLLHTFTHNCIQSQYSCFLRLAITLFLLQFFLIILYNTFYYNYNYNYFILLPKNISHNK